MLINDCDTCFQISCGNCDWEANSQEIEKVRNGQLRECPKCGWSPNQQVNLQLVLK